MKKKFKCGFCKKEFIDYITNRLSKRVFCKRKCKADFMKIQKGNQTPRWKNAVSNHNQGYNLITRDGKTYLEHRYIIEKQLGRELAKNEHVHHLNGDKKDNRLENLILLTQSEHARIHFIGNKRAQRYFPQKYINGKLSKAYEEGLFKECNP